jgi:hypothetical protein
LATVERHVLSSSFCVAEISRKLSSWPEIGLDGDVLLTPYVPKGITGYDDDDDEISRPV